MAAETAYRQLGVDEVLMIPAGSPWQKAGAAVSSAHHRWAMTELAAEGADWLVPDDREVHRQGWTYTADTLATFADDDKLVLVMGADAAANLPSWDRYEQVIGRADIAVAPRITTKPEIVTAAIGDVTWLDMPILEVSGTDIRERAAAGKAMRYLVREGVYDYLSDHHLYDL